MPASQANFTFFDKLRADFISALTFYYRTCHAIVRVTAYYLEGSLPRIRCRACPTKKGGRIAITGKLVQGVRNTTPLKE